MPEYKDFAMPDVGEGLTEADIVKWLVAPGDTIVVNQLIVEIETAKAVVELPAPFAGIVTALHGAEGDTVDVGRPIITVDVDPGGAADVEPAADAQPARQSVLVGYGPKADTAPTRRARSTPAAPAPLASPERHRVLAKPPVRKLAKSLGVDLAEVPATGPSGTISREDVESAARVPAAPASRAGNRSGAHSGDRSGDRETRIPIKGVRKHTAAAMVASAFTAPHVTEFVTVDVTPMVELRERIGRRPEFGGVKVSPLVLLARAVLLAARRTPEINSTWDEPAGEIVLKQYVNLGIAAATERGLIVPNIKDAEQLSLLELAQAIAELTATARSGRTQPADMAGGTITITNVGVFGVDTGTPIINPGEAAIVCFGAVRRMPWVVDEQVVPRWVTQLSVSFDHRLVDGQQGSQFLADVAGMLADPGLGLL